MSPAAKVPPRLVILADTREQTIPPFPAGCVVQRATLGEGDYTTHALRTVAVIERKSISDFCSTISAGRERFEREIVRLKAYRWRCVVVEGNLSEAFRSTRMHPHSIVGTVASFYARSDVPTFFLADPATVGRFVAGVLRRWEQRLVSERAA